MSKSERLALYREELVSAGIDPQSPRFQLLVDKRSETLDRLRSLLR
jgi:hypothetical protein